MASHQWVEFMYMPITVEVDEPTGDITTFTYENAEELAKEYSKEGCWNCMIPLNINTVNTECPGEDEG